LEYSSYTLTAAQSNAAAQSRRSAKPTQRKLVLPQIRAENRWPLKPHTQHLQPQPSPLATNASHYTCYHPPCPLLHGSYSQASKHLRRHPLRSSSHLPTRLSSQLSPLFTGGKLNCSSSPSTPSVSSSATRNPSPLANSPITQASAEPSWLTFTVSPFAGPLCTA